MGNYIVDESSLYPEDWGVALAPLPQENFKGLISRLGLVKYFEAYDLLATLKGIRAAAEIIIDGPDPQYRIAAIEQFGDRLRESQKLLSDAGLPTSALHALRLLTSVSADPGLQGGKPVLQTEYAIRIVEMLTNTVECELASHKYLELTAENKPFYDEPKRGWELIIARFPDAVTDVEDMHKCFALERYSASVFHSLQAVEHGLIELGTYIGVADPKSGWTAVSARLSKITTTKYPDRTAFEQAHSDFIEQVQGTVEALKNAWRNKISHAQGKVKLSATFDRNIAEEIMMASRAFMSRLASDLPAKVATP